MFLNKHLFKVHSNGSVGTWQIQVVSNGNGTATMTRTACKVIGGNPVVTVTEYTEGKNIGRANETTPLQQALNEAESRYRKQLDKGYVVEQPEAGAAVTNTLGFPKPMLATPIEKVKGWEFPVYASKKLDGHRMLAAVRDGQVVLYSRQGKVVDVEHIRNQLQHAYDNAFWGGDILDGEVYLHGETLQRISSLVKKPKPESKNLVFHVYDTLVDTPYAVRKGILHNNLGKASLSHVEVLQQERVENQADLDTFHARNVAENYEGTMVRWGDAVYEDGKRSKSLMKMKDFKDDEFKIVAVGEGKPTIRGDVTYRLAVYTCVTKDGKTFECTAPGTMQEKHDAAERGDADIGKYLTVKYFNMTPDGVPFLPVGLRLREDI